MDFRAFLLVVLVVASFLGTMSAVVHNVTKLGINNEVSFPLKSGEINGKMVIVDSRQVN